jgi:hypothetical protein
MPALWAHRRASERTRVYRRPARDGGPSGVRAASSGAQVCPLMVSGACPAELPAGCRRGNIHPIDGYLTHSHCHLQLLPRSSHTHFATRSLQPSGTRGLRGLRPHPAAETVRWPPERHRNRVAKRRRIGLMRESYQTAAMLGEVASVTASACDHSATPSSLFQFLHPRVQFLHRA